MTETEQPAATTTNKSAESKNKPINHKWLWCLLLLLLLLGIIAWLGWLLMLCNKHHDELHDQNTKLEQQIDTLKQDAAKATTTTKPDEKAVTDKKTTSTCNDTPSESLKENIKAALDSKNTAAIGSYASNPVKYVLAASEYGGDFTPDEAATALEYTHSATGPWDFSLPAATLAAYDAGYYTTYFDANTYVGRAASGMVAAFDFNCDGKISQIFVAADEDLLM